MFVVSGGLRSKALVFVGEMQISHFRHFRQTPFLAEDKNTAYQKHGHDEDA